MPKPDIKLSNLEKSKEAAEALRDFFHQLGEPSEESKLVFDTLLKVIYKIEDAKSR